MLPTTQFAYRKGLGTCDALLCVAHTLQSVLEMGQEARIVEIDLVPLLTGSTIKGFSSSCSVGGGGSVLSVLPVSL